MEKAENKRAFQPEDLVSRNQKKKRYKRNLLTSPGTLTYIGPDVELKTKIRKIVYNDQIFRDEPVKSLLECSPEASNEKAVTWLDVDGIHETALIAKLGKLYHLHPLLLEDVVNTEHKPKLEIYDNGHLFLTLKMLHIDSESPICLSAEHVSFVLGENYLLSFQEELSNDIFTPVLDRLQASVGKTRRNGADYLLFALMDIVIDNYFIVLEKLGDSLDTVEDQVIRGTEELSLKELYSLKRELTIARRVIWPLRDMINQLIREDNPLISKETIPYLRDLYDHVMQVLDTIDSYRELVASLADVHLSTISNRMNSVMKTLTIFSAVFMPLTFIVGVYGMNFDNMPELRVHNGYYYVWGLMIAVTIGLIFYFKSKKWM
ncbi:magnesium/cobalt transporter CorA [Dyadobacter fanqingshengii]|uniref:Magnesium transport protein CorA n=1 Tax=Dyadobacter fanqingshengii TaxID=2906443 RepID=A0A9X1P602_9BACT|nr:magnesium/cobalt transporter CorA [Dyadobacter fanqingshengii]MCF0039474.1 magnesium/cobalt transporter CorA [Dyadobacter fanqingshengii]USJ33717.1 magnesium/cobalt transporter CorA [Dyadobacter fanqingshengii]